MPVVLLGTLCALGAPATLAQRPDVAPSAPSDRWSVSGAHLHLNAGSIRRQAAPSLGVAVARTLGAGGVTRAPRLEAGWLRASRVGAQAQGVTLGLSVGLPVAALATADGPSTPVLTLRPGAALLAGWAEAQGREDWYAWRGIPGTPSAGQTGTASRYFPVRGRTTGAGASLAAELRLTRAVALTAAVQRWTFTGAVLRPARAATLAGAGLTLRPATLGRDVRGWWRHAAGRPVAGGARGTFQVPVAGATADGATSGAIRTPAAGGTR